MPRGIPNNKMSNDKQVIAKAPINEQTEDTTDSTQDSSVVVQSVAQEVEPKITKHASNIHSYNWTIEPQGDEVYTFTNKVTEESFTGTMTQFNKILKG
jgi:hypothetical protein